MTRASVRAATIAIVEDDEDIREAMEALLEHAGYNVIGYASAELALKEMRAGAHPDLILLDLMMPGMNGWQFRMLQKQDATISDIPVIAVSADVSPYAAAIDAAAYVRKPVDFGSLCRTIEEVLLSAERQRLSAKAIEMERIHSLGMLVASVAHEINNPLTYVVGCLDLAESQCAMLKRKPETASVVAPRLEENIRAIRDGAERIEFIVQLLATFARGGEHQSKSVSPLRAIDAAVRIAMHRIRERARFVSHLEPVPNVRANEAQLAQVFLNLLINAAQAIPTGAADQNEVRMRCFREDERVVVEVEDTGVGVLPEVAGKIFQPFYTTKPPGTGTGLGLSISRDIVAACGGALSVQSDGRRGATFRVELPVEHPPAESDDGGAAGGAGAQGHIRLVGGKSGNDSRWRKSN